MLRTLSRARARAHTLYAPCRVPRMERYMERSDKAYMEAILALNLLPRFLLVLHATADASTGPGHSCPGHVLISGSA